MSRAAARRDHREAVLLLGDADVEQHRAVGLERLAHRLLEVGRRSRQRIPVAPKASASFTQSGLAPSSTEL